MKYQGLIFGLSLFITTVNTLYWILDDSCFIVGDQPVINTYATFDMLTPPNDVELFYPVTPYTTLLLTTDRKYISGQLLKIGIHDVEKYNMLEVRASREQVYAKDSAQLKNICNYTVRK